MSVKLRFILFWILIISFWRCYDSEPKPITEYIHMTEIQKVELNNIKGKHVLSDKELEKFLTAFSQCTTEPNLQIKTGSISIIFTLKNGETYVARGNNRSDYLEISSNFATQNKHLIQGDWIVLNTQGINYNNF